MKKALLLVGALAASSGLAQTFFLTYPGQCTLEPLQTCDQAIEYANDVYDSAEGSSLGWMAAGVWALYIYQEPLPRSSLGHDPPMSSNLFGIGKTKATAVRLEVADAGATACTRP